jgi:hypothetical protein
MLTKSETRRHDDAAATPAARRIEYTHFPVRRKTTLTKRRLFDWLLAFRYSATSQTNRRIQPNLCGDALSGHFENPATPQPLRRSDFQNARSVPLQTCFRL